MATHERLSHVESVCSFWLLPQELRDMVFGFAYPASPQLRRVVRSDCVQQTNKIMRWVRREYTGPPHLDAKMNEWLVSKQYFAEAAKAWFSAQHWTEQALFGTSRVATDDFMYYRVGLFLQFTRKFTVRLSLRHLDRLLLSMPALRELHILVRAENFAEGSQKLVWQELLTTDELLQCEAVSQLRGGAGLRRLSMHADICPLANTEDRRAIWAQNVAALEAIVRAKLLNPIFRPARSSPPAGQVDCGGSTSRCVRLYPRSNVCFTCSRLHPGDEARCRFERLLRQMSVQLPIAELHEGRVRDAEAWLKSGF